jgi:gas vesicle protein
MSERSRVLGASLLGAVIGGAIGYLYLTDNGRRFRVEMEPKLDQFAAEFRRLKRTLSTAQEVAADGWRTLSEMAGDRPRSAAWPAEQQRQRTPF